ncbi:MAG: alanine:cation symporter family protein [Lachnospiraceae bacterium]|nr:alanine:cation symporter family protein [Lachnospiraceae bacterium]
MFGEIIGKISGIMYGYVLIIMLIAVGLYFTIKTKFVQFKLFGESIRLVTEKPTEEGQVSSFQALMVSTASRVGTGNIVGVSTAICLGGYGAVFWMWIIAILGGASAFIESTLAQIYKRRDSEGNSYGGPAYYIEAALKNPILGALFAISMLLTYAGGFNMLASYNLQSTFSVYSWYNASWTPAVIGAILAVLVGYCLLGGGKRIIHVTSALVPFMGLLYVVVAILIVIMHIGLLPGVIGQIFADAFNFKAIFGGFSGSCMMYGIKRGLYSNEAGVGSAPNAAAASAVSHPVKQGLVQMLSVFIDTLLLCTCTALMCLCSGVAPSADIAGASYVQAAMQNALGAFGPIFVTVAMVLFAFTTLLGNFYYVDNLLIYLNGKKEPSKQFMFCFRIIAAVIIFLGALMSMGTVWDLADVLMGIMAIINLPVICIAGGTAIKALEDYVEQKKAGKDPVFKASTVGLEGKTDYWN